jgi:hypothetical protein
MNERTVQSDAAEVRRLDRRRRAKRGLVAGYIHGLSARHQDAGGREPDRSRAALAPGRKA